MKEKKLNCWEVKKCGRGPHSLQINGSESCPVAKEARLDGVHGGKYSGRACWVVAGTYCGGKVQGTHACKFDVCQKCDFYQLVQKEEGEKFQRPLFLLSRLRSPARRVDISQKKLGVLIGGSGLIGGGLLYYFKTKKQNEVELLSPNSKKLSLRVPEDIKEYFKQYRPDFIVNAAIAPLGGGAQLAYETNYVGCINLAKVAMALKIPYIHFSSAATMPDAEGLTEDQTLPLSAKMPHYAKSKLMAEKTLHELYEKHGLDYTIIKLGVVYGKHDHKIQGFHRLLFSVASGAMPFLMTKKGVMHSYTNPGKIPPFIHYILQKRDEFSGQTYHFVDHNPVQLNQLILTIKSYLELTLPKEFYVSYPLAKTGIGALNLILKGLNKMGVEARLPPELMFMESFYKSQTLSTDKLINSSYGNPDAEKSIFTELPSIIKYYMTRWQNLNLVTPCGSDAQDQQDKTSQFINDPASLLEEIKMAKVNPFANFDDLCE